MDSNRADSSVFPGDASERLESWKEIAAYLKRDIRTVQRWERHAGLPVHRLSHAKLGGVFAYKTALDAWRAAAAPAATRTQQPAWRTWIAIGVVAALALAFVWRVTTTRTAGEDLHVIVSAEAVVAIDSRGNERWRHTFPSSLMVAPAQPAVAVIGRKPAVYVGVTDKVRKLDQTGEGGELTEFDISGTVQRAYSFRDRVTLANGTYGPPWALPAFAVDERDGQRRIALVARHYIWSTSLVTILDENWQRRGTFTHAGWLESVVWLGPNRLLVGGFSQSHDGGVLALLDPDALNGQGPEPPESEFHCSDCGGGRPLKIVVLPRSEVNDVSGSPFNRAIAQIVAGRVLARTVEVPATQYGIEAIYELTDSLELVSASFGDRYWETHRLLEQEGKLDHSRERCPDRSGPRAILVWEPSTGWRTKAVRPRS